MRPLQVLIVISVFLFACEGAHRLQLVNVLNGKKGFGKAFPYMAAIERLGKNVCAGTILTRRAILTAAHCFDDTLKTPTYKVRVGSEKREKGGFLYDIEKPFKHEAYKSVDKFSYDIAIVWIKGLMTFDRSISALPLPKGSDPLLVGHDGIVSGWGKITKSGVRPTVLYFASLTIFSQKECEEKFPSVKTGVKMFCAGSPSTGTCHGDSGAPFVVNGKVYGIVAYGRKSCDTIGAPAVFMDMRYFSNWVTTALGKNQPSSKKPSHLVANDA